MAVLVDTCVISEVRHPRGAVSVKEAFAALDERDVFFSVITLGEIAAGIARLDDGRRRRGLAEWLDGLEQLFPARILPISAPIARIWGELTVLSRAAGRPLAVSDGLIAATARHHGLSVMTRNVGDFGGTGVAIVNPWDV